MAASLSGLTTPHLCLSALRRCQERRKKFLPLLRLRFADTLQSPHARCPRFSLISLSYLPRGLCTVGSSILSQLMQVAHPLLDMLDLESGRSALVPAVTAAQATSASGQNSTRGADSGACSPASSSPALASSRVCLGRSRGLAAGAQAARAARYMGRKTCWGSETGYYYLRHATHRLALPQSAHRVAVALSACIAVVSSR